MKRIYNLKIKLKLVIIILVITVLALILASTAAIIISNEIFLESLTEEICTTSHISAKNIGISLSFFRPDEIPRELLILQKMSTIKKAYVYDTEGELLVPHASTHKGPLGPPSYILKKKLTIQKTGKYLYISQPLEIEKDYFGTLYIIASTETVTQKMQKFKYWLIGLIVILIALSLILANQLQGIISKPILNLVHAAKDISLRGDYSVRVQKKDNDEIGMLYDEFNQMMEQIQERDIQRDQVKNQLRTSQLFLSRIIESMPSLLIAIQPNGIIKEWNKAAAKNCGIESMDAIGANLWELLPSFSDLKPDVTACVETQKAQDFYKKYIKLNGNPFYFNGSIFPLIDDNDIRLIIMLNDITETELKDQQLRQSQKMETVGNLAGGLAHDFNNVLGGIIGTISLFKYKLSRKQEISTQDIDKYFTTIEESSNRAADMVKHLLSLTRKHELNFSPTDLNNVVRHIVKICTNTFDRSIEIDTIYYQESAFTHADPTQIEQSILNLCINASHAMTIMREDGSPFGGKLSIVISKTLVDKYFRDLYPEAEEDEYWDISITDTGVGIDKKIISKIFDPFFTTKTNGQGTGLGLSMVYNIIKQHKGFVNVYSQPGFGTTFNIYLPVLKESFEALPVLPAETIHHGEGLILIVDDEDVMRITAKSILLECGYSVITAENGIEALAIYTQRKNDIKAVILDMVMPRMSGKQTYLELIKINKDVKVLLSSGFKQDERVESILKLGVADFLQKPFTLTALANAVFKLLYGTKGN